MKSWEHQKELQKKQLPTQYDIIDMAAAIDNLRTRALFIMQYLTAGRITEIVQCRKLRKQKAIREDDKIVGLNKWEDEINYIGIRKKDILKDTKNGRKILLIRLPNRKHPKKKIKEIPVPMDRDVNEKLVNLLFEYTQTLSSEDSPLFPFGSRRAYQLLRKTLGYNTHFVRHIRATHLVMYNDLNEQLLVRYMGWTDSKPAKNYMELKWADLLDKL